MTSRLIAVIAFAALATGCSRTAETPAADDAAASSPPAAPAAEADQPRGDVPPATAPPGSLPPRLRQDPAALARLDGYGDLRLGMDAAQARAAWGGALRGDAAADGGCYLLRPQWADDARRFGFMFEGDRLVRYQTNEPKEVAPGGGRVGMTVAEVRAVSRWPGGTTAQVHPRCAEPAACRRPIAKRAGVRHRCQRQGDQLARGGGAAGGLRGRLRLIRAAQRAVLCVSVGCVQ